MTSGFNICPLSLDQNHKPSYNEVREFCQDLINILYLLLVFASEAGVSEALAQGEDVVLDLGRLDLVVGLNSWTMWTNHSLDI